MHYNNQYRVSDGLANGAVEKLILIEHEEAREVIRVWLTIFHAKVV